MARAQAPLNALRVGDLSTVMLVSRHQSFARAARELKTTTSHVSKVVARVERVAGRLLFLRTPTGAQVAPGAAAVLDHLEAALGRLQGLRQSAGPSRMLTFAAPSYLNSALFPRIAARLGDVRLRSIDLPPGLLGALARERFFDFALSTEVEQFPQNWAWLKLGQLQSRLFASPALARRLGGKRVTPDQLKGIPFIRPIYMVNGHLTAGPDNCPLALEERTPGHEVQTFGLALQVAAETEQLVFGPTILAHPHLRARRLATIEVEGWDVAQPLYLSCAADRVLQKEQSVTAEAIREAVESTEA